VIENAILLVSLVAKLAWLVLEPLLWPALAFGLLAIVVKGWDAFEAARHAATETRVTLLLYVFDLLLIGPPLGIAVALIARTVERHSVTIVPGDVWASMGPAAIFVTVFAGDFFSYWRHRLEHTRWLWPAHAIHHSDTEMTWLTGTRFHPVNRLVTAVIDNTLLALLGAPVWAITLNELFRHYYGEFIHADVPWTYGRAGAIFVSPAMHRWHHARDVKGAGSNFATIFSVFDRAFGTHHVPGPCNVPLGVTDDIGPGAARQLTYPFKCWISDVVQRTRQRMIFMQTPPPASARRSPSPESEASIG
jgi:sterol desaturase/sphingolipid hydroxylase (fatty acid hydroxylase superfamily)